MWKGAAARALLDIASLYFLFFSLYPSRLCSSPHLSAFASGCSFFFSCFSPLWLRYTIGRAPVLSLMSDTMQVQGHLPHHRRLAANMAIKARGNSCTECRRRKQKVSRYECRCCCCCCCPELFGGAVFHLPFPGAPAVLDISSKSEPPAVGAGRDGHVPNPRHRPVAHGQRESDRKSPLNPVAVCFRRRKGKSR